MKVRQKRRQKRMKHTRAEISAKREILGLSPIRIFHISNLGSYVRESWALIFILKSLLRRKKASIARSAGGSGI